MLNCSDTTAILAINTFDVMQPVSAFLQVLGILSLFFMPVPLFLKQCYTVWVGICVAYIFTHIPEWTSWVLLVIMALYDLAAVLMPGGPLKVSTWDSRSSSSSTATSMPIKHVDSAVKCHISSWGIVCLLPLGFASTSSLCTGTTVLVVNKF